MRLIDADELIKRFEAKSDEMMKLKEPTMSGAVLGATYMISQADTIPAITVLRCHECRYYKAPVVTRDSGICVFKNRNELVEYDGYCSGGKKK